MSLRLSGTIPQTPVENRSIIDSVEDFILNRLFLRFNTSTVELSCKSEYALLALIELAVHHSKGEPLQIRQIAAQQGIPDRYLEQLLATLRRGGLVRSQRGAKGGYHLAREPWNITLLDALECIEGITEQSTTAQDTAPTVESGIIKDIWSEAQEAAEGVLKKYTLQDLREQRDARSQLNIMYYI